MPRSPYDDRLPSYLQQRMGLLSSPAGLPGFGGGPGSYGLVTGAGVGDPLTTSIPPSALPPKKGGSSKTSTPTMTSGAGGYTSPEEAKARGDADNWWQKQPIIVGGPDKLDKFAGYGANALFGFQSTRGPAQAAEAARRNEQIYREDAQRVLAGGGYEGARHPDILKQGITHRSAVDLHRLQKEHDLDLKKQEFEWKQGAEKAKQDALRELIVRATPEEGGAGLPGGAPQMPPSAMPPGQPDPFNGVPGAGIIQPPAGAAGPPQSSWHQPPPAQPIPVQPGPEPAFADKLLAPPHVVQGTMSRRTQAALALAFGEEKTAIDILIKQGKDPIDAQRNAAGFAERMLSAEIMLRGISGFDPTTYMRGLADKYGPNFIHSADYQRYARGAEEWLTAMLRKESGATFTPYERESYFKQYFPQFNDSPQLVKEKEGRRIAIARGVRMASGPAFDQFYPGFDGEKRKELALYESQRPPPKKGPEDPYAPAPPEKRYGIFPQSTPPPNRSISAPPQSIAPQTNLEPGQKPPGPPLRAIDKLREIINDPQVPQDKKQFIWKEFQRKYGANGQLANPMDYLQPAPEGPEGLQ